MQTDSSKLPFPTQAATGGGAGARADHVSRFRLSLEPPTHRPATDPPGSPLGVSLPASVSRCRPELSASVPGCPGSGQVEGLRPVLAPPCPAHLQPVPAGSASQEAQPSEGSSTDLRQAWCDLLGRWPWDLFGNHTFREDTHPESAFKRFRLFISILNRKLYGPRWHKRGQGIRWVCAMERQARGVVHFHSLLASPELVELLRSSWVPAGPDGMQNEILELWNSLAGFARIEPIESAELVRGYVSKYVVKGGEIELGGPGMPVFEWEGHPARVDRRWLNTAMGKAVGLARIQRVVTPEELQSLLGNMQERRSTWRGVEVVNVQQADRRGMAALIGEVRARVRTPALNLR